MAMQNIGAMVGRSQQRSDTTGSSPSERQREPLQVPPVVTRLMDAMTAAYGALFMSRVPNARAMDAWESLWTGIFDGKDRDVIRAAIRECFETHREPFTPADFSAAYQRITARPIAAHRRNDDALALPSKTWEERQMQARQAMAELKAKLAERGSAALQAEIGVQAPAEDEPKRQIGPDPESPEYVAMIERRKREATEALAEIEKRRQRAAGEP